MLFAAAIVRTMSQHPAGTEVYEAAGPQAAPLAHWVRLAGRFSGHPRPILPLPAALAWLGGISALDIIALIGGITALLAALMAVQQNDIKRILAYSTLSQLGYMVMAVGLHAPGPAMFHLTTHAAFKALLFLGAGSVIYACHHEQNIWKMGGLRDAMPRTWWTFRWGTLALCGVWPFAGFFSKDAILAAATVTIATTVPLEAALTYLNVGLAPPTPSWGAVLQDAADRPLDAWWLLLFPSAAIAATVMAVQVIGERLQPGARRPHSA